MFALSSSLWLFFSNLLFSSHKRVIVFLQVYHYRVNKSGVSSYFISKDSVFPSLRELITSLGSNASGAFLQFLSQFPLLTTSLCRLGLVCCLKFPVRKNSAEVYGVSREVDDMWEIDRLEISLGSKLGAGQYGEVYKGSLKHRSAAGVVLVGGSGGSIFHFNVALFVFLVSLFRFVSFRDGGVSFPVFPRFYFVHNSPLLNIVFFGA